MTQDSNATGSVADQGPAFSSFASFSSPPGSQSMTPQPGQQAFAPPAAASAPTPAADPFAALSGTTSSTQAAKAPAAPSGGNDDDEWNFASSLPEAPSKPKEQRATLNSTNLRVDYIAGRSTPGANSLALSFAFSNNLAQPISELHFQLAVTKVRPHVPFPSRGMRLTSIFVGFRTAAQATEWPRAGPQAEPGRHTVC